MSDPQTNNQISNVSVQRNQSLGPDQALNQDLRSSFEPKLSLTDDLPIRKKILKTKHKRKQILIKALECFSNNGLAKTTLSEIAQKSNMTPSHLLYHYKSTTEIFEELCEAMFSEAQTRSKAYSKKSRLKADMVKAYINAMFDWLFSDRNYQKLLLQFYAESFYNQNLKALRNKMFREAHDYLTFLLQDKVIAKIVQNLLMGSLLEFAMSHNQDIAIRQIVLDFIDSLNLNERR